jgi:hypothetical protein
MRFPSIQKNGTSRAALFGQYSTALEAVSRAAERVKNTAPLQRDYSQKDDDDFYGALAEHRRRVQLLREVEKELLLIIEAISHAPKPTPKTPEQAPPTLDNKPGV